MARQWREETEQQKEFVSSTLKMKNDTKNNFSDIKNSTIWDFIQSCKLHKDVKKKRNLVEELLKMSLMCNHQIWAASAHKRQNGIWIHYLDMLIKDSRMKGWGVCYTHNSNVKYMYLIWMTQSNFSYKIIKAMMRSSNPSWIIPHITVGC